MGLRIVLTGRVGLEADGVDVEDTAQAVVEAGEALRRGDGEGARLDSASRIC